MNTKAAFVLAAGMIGAAFIWTDKAGPIAVAHVEPSTTLGRLPGQ